MARQRERKTNEGLKQKAPPLAADINVTPMVDVMLVLLIIFMVITPMLSKGKDVDKVKARNPIPMQAADKSDAVLVAITHDGKVFLGIRLPIDRQPYPTLYEQRNRVPPSRLLRLGEA